MIRVDLEVDELEAVLVVVGAKVSDEPRAHGALERAEFKLDLALMDHEGRSR